MDSTIKLLLKRLKNLFAADQPKKIKFDTKKKKMDLETLEY